MLYTIYYTILCYRVILYSTTILYYYSMLYYTVSFHIIPIEESSGIRYRPHIRCPSIRQHQQPENKCQYCKPYAITEILIGSWSSFLFHMVITRKMVPPPTPKKWCGGIYSPILFWFWKEKNAAYWSNMMYTWDAGWWMEQRTVRPFVAMVLKQPITFCAMKESNPVVGSSHSISEGLVSNCWWYKQ